MDADRAREWYDANSRSLTPEQNQYFAMSYARKAIKQGDREADLLRRNVAINMTDEQFARARLLVKQHDLGPGSASRNPRRRPGPAEDGGGLY